MSITSKIRKIHELLSEGRYNEIPLRILYNILPWETASNLMYLYLSRKYRPFISEYKLSKITQQGGGGKDIIWRLWLQGEDNAPPVCKACLRSLHFWCPDKKIITLDQYNISDYISLPGYIIDKHNRGIISHTHFSDIIRAELLIQHGGTWIDSTVFCTGRKFTEFMQLPLFASNTSNLYPFYMVASSWFIVSEAHNPIITLTRDLLFEYWKSHNYLIHYFLFHMFFKMAAKKYPEEWSRVPYVDNAPWIEMGKAAYDDYSDEKMKYFAGLSDLHKMSYKFDSERLTPSSILQHVIDSYK